MVQLDVFNIMLSDTINDMISSSENSCHEADKQFPQMYFNQKSLNFKSEMKFFNLKFKSIGDNLCISRDKSLKLNKNVQNDTMTHKFSIDNILGQLKNDETEEHEKSDKEESGGEFEMKENSIKFTNNCENGKYLIRNLK